MRLPATAPELHERMLYSVLTQPHSCRDFVLMRLPAIAPELRERLLAGMLTELPLLARQDESFPKLLSATAFVPTEAGGLKPPSQLYDPR